LLQDGSVDEITFGNRLVGSDDPTIGALYNATSAVRHLHNNTSRGKAVGRVHTHLAIDGTQQAVTGDSLGLATALLLYVQLQKPEIRRIENALGGDVAVTGAVDADGSVRAISNESISAKVTRAFFSPVNSLVVPKENADTAQTHVCDLERQYPNRRLRLVPVGHVSELIQDRNVVRAERVCIGKFVGRKAAKWTRTVKFQVPLLIALLYVLVCLGYPKAWPWFDWHIARIEIVGNQFKTLNVNGVVLWRSQPFEYELDTAFYHGATTRYWAVDVDDDSKDELFFVHGGDSRFTPSILYYEHYGKVVWRESAVLKTTYPGDMKYDQYPEEFFYEGPDFLPLSVGNGRVLVMTSCAASNPWRHQLMTFDSSGLVAGPYLSTGAGSLGAAVVMDIDADSNIDVILSGNSTDIQRVVMLAIDPLHLEGVNPPYSTERYLLSRMPKGSQLRYVTLPESPLSAGTEVYNTGWGGHVFDPTTQQFRVIVAEGYFLPIGGKRMTDIESLPKLYWTLNKDLIPVSLTFEAGSSSQMNQLLVLDGRAPVGDFDHLKDSLLSEVIVYHGNSVVHHPAEGIYFHPEDNK
jgi:hypothetical protein